MIDRIKNNKIIIGVILGLIIILTNLQFLPTIGELNLVGFSNLTYNGLTMICILFVLIGFLGLIGLIWSLISNKKLNKIALIIIALGLFGYLNATIIPKYMSGFAKNIVIKNANGLISSIDNYYNDNSLYPDSLEILIPKYLDKIPKPGVNGIGGYQYENFGNNYEIRFYQNDIMSFNFDVVIYNPKGEHKGDGEQPELIEIGFENWKYYWFD